MKKNLLPYEQVLIESGVKVLHIYQLTKYFRTFFHPFLSYNYLFWIKNKSWGEKLKLITL